MARCGAQAREEEEHASNAARLAQLDEDMRAANQAVLVCPGPNGMLRIDAFNLSFQNVA